MQDLNTIFLQAKENSFINRRRNYPIRRHDPLSDIKQYTDLTKGEHVNTGSKAAQYFDEMYAEGQDAIHRELNGGELSDYSPEQLEAAGQQLMTTPFFQKQFAAIQDKMAQHQIDIQNGDYTADDVKANLQAKAMSFKGDLPNPSARITKYDDVTGAVDREFGQVPSMEVNSMTGQSLDDSSTPTVSF